MEKGYSAKVDVLVVHDKPLGFELLFGIDAIKALGGIIFGPMGSVKISNDKVPMCATISINEPDFTVTVDHHSRTWTAVWKWSEDCVLERLQNEVAEYPLAMEILKDYEEELHTWKDSG